MHMCCRFSTGADAYYMQTLPLRHTPILADHFYEVLGNGTREMAHKLRMLTALAEDLGSNPRTHIVLSSSIHVEEVIMTACISSSPALDNLFWPHM